LRSLCRRERGWFPWCRGQPRERGCIARLEKTWLGRVPRSNSARQIIAPGAVGGRPALDPGFEHPQLVIEMHEAREMARRDAAKFFVGPEKGRRNARCHGERVAEIEPDDVNDVTNRFVHCQNGTRERSIVEPQAAICARYAAALQIKMIGPAGRR